MFRPQEQREGILNRFAFTRGVGPAAPGNGLSYLHLRAQGWEKNPRQRELAGGKLPAPSEAEGTCSEARPALVTLQGEPQGEAL